MPAEQQTPALAAERVITRAVESPLVRGGLILGAGIVTGNLLGFVRVALTAYLLGTHSAADSLAVAVGPIDTLNAVLTNTVVFAFVPMLTAREGADRIALFLKLDRVFACLFSLLTGGIVAFAPQLIHILAPGLAPAYYPQAVNLLRIICFSSMAAGAAAVHSALLYTDRRFAPSAFYQASVNLFTIICAVTLWNSIGIYGFAIGYALGAWVQLGVVYYFARSGINRRAVPHCDIRWRELLAKPGTILVYSGVVGLNLTVARAYATHAGPGMAAALEYSWRCIGVPLAFLVNPVSNTVLPEIARLRSLGRLRDAFRLIDKTIGLVGLAGTAACAIGIAIRQPVIAIMFQRGSFTSESTKLVSAVFLGFAPSLIGWALFELTSRALFALEHLRLPLYASAIPVICNLGFTLAIRSPRPEFLGLGASLGFIVAFVVLFSLAGARRKQLLRAAIQ